MSQEHNSNGASDKKAAVPMLVLAVFLLGAVLSYLGIKPGVLSNIAEDRKALAYVQRTDKAVPGDTSADAGLMQAKAAALLSQQCSGCHDFKKRLVGPSYVEIARRYKNMPLDVLAEAIKHPPSVWASYPVGPSLNLAADERMALAYWIQNAQNEKSSVRGVAGEPKQ